jgi:O-antigen ligase
MKSIPARSETQQKPRSPLSSVALIGLPILGFTAGLPEYTEFQGFSLHLIVALFLATLGWLVGLKGRMLRRYTLSAGLLALWFCVSAIAAWDSGTINRSLTASVWLVFVAPGVANLLREVSHRRALLGGMIGAATFYSVTALGRIAMGREMFDGPMPSRALLLGEKRGYVNARLLYVVPFLLANTAKRLGRVRWILLFLAVGTMLRSGDRASILGLTVVALSFALLQPGASSRIRALTSLGILAIAFVMLIGQFGDAATVGRNRLVGFIRGDRTTSDDIRELQLKRAWHVGLENPAFGVGFGNLAGLDHPALDEARNAAIRGRAQSFGVHNTYAQIWGEFGIPGTAAFLFLLLWTLRAGIRRSADPEIRAVTSGFFGLLFTMLVNPTSLPFLYLMLAYLVGVLDGETVTADEDSVAAEPSPA